MLSTWTVDVDSVYSVVGYGMQVLVWNLPLHAWSWPTLVEVFKPVGELVTITKGSSPNKELFSILVRQKVNAGLPHEIELSFGMRKFFILITDLHAPFPTFRLELEKYIHIVTRCFCPNNDFLLKTRSRCASASKRHS